MILTYDFGPMNSTYDILTYEKKNQDFSPKKLYVQPTWPRKRGVGTEAPQEQNM